MNYRNRTKSLLFVLAGGMLMQTACNSSRKTGGTAGNEKVIFFDDFSGTSLDRSKWNVFLTGYVFNNEQQAYIDSSSTLSIVHGSESEGASNGALRFRPQFTPGFKTADGTKFDFTSARINTKGKVDFVYGTASARIKMTAGEGLWPAWWMLGSGNWPATGETDIMEYIGEKDWAGPAVHGPGYSGETPFVNKHYFPAGNDITTWHIYAVEWTRDSLLFKYDDTLVLRITRPMVEHYGKWVFDNPNHLLLNFALGGAFPVKMNGVKKPYYGLPQSTVDLIKNNESKMLVDWVKITQPQ